MKKKTDTLEKNRDRYYVTETTDCGVCYGRGQEGPTYCVTCGGTGTITTRVSLVGALEDLGLLDGRGGG